MTLRLRPYDPIDAQVWDAFCEVAHQATFMHSRQFLSYHGERFRDRSVILEDGDGWVGVFPAALLPGDESCVVSHPGITYGGFLHKGALAGKQMITALSMICRYYLERGHSRLIYKAVPWFYHATPAQDDLYALFRLGARRTRCDLSSTIDLHCRRQVSERRRRSLKKALRAGVDILEGDEYLPAFWQVVTENLNQKHQAVPVHTLEEVMLLAERFPNNVHCVVGLVGDEVIAGILLFTTPLVVHAQYIGSSTAGYKMSVLDAVFERCIEQALSDRKRWFDFGISTESQGQVLNEGLYRFKSEFGGGGTVHEFYEINLRDVQYAA
jgi:hypothetical protein